MDFIKEKNRIFCKDEQGKIIAEITYNEIKPGVYNINHTENSTETSRIGNKRNKK